LAPEHNLKNFDCGKKSLNDWLKDNARRSEAKGAARTYVLCEENEVVGYYSLSNGAVMKSHYLPQESSGLPNMIPGILIGRFAIHKARQRSGLGTKLAVDAFENIVKVACWSGVVAAYLHVDEQSAFNFWVQLGFQASLDDPSIDDTERKSIELYIPVATLRKVLAE